MEARLRIKKRNRGSRAISPTISTVILMGTTIAMLMVAIVFVNNNLWSRVAESEFSSAKQYMQTIGLQVDDVAWTVGRKETVRYASSYGSVSFLQNAINYTISVKTQGDTVYRYFTHNISSAILFNMPTSRYSLADGYYENIYPQTRSGSITFSGTSAPIARVFAVEKLGMSGGNFARVVVTPAIRVLSSSVNSTSNKVYYLKLYLPVIKAGSAQGSAQSITMTGTSLETRTLSKITSIKITVTIPTVIRAQGFEPDSFFHYSSTSQEIIVPGGYNDAILEIYAGRVETVLGVQN